MVHLDIDTAEIPCSQGAKRFFGNIYDFRQNISIRNQLQNFRIVVFNLRSQDPYPTFFRRYERR